MRGVPRNLSACWAKSVAAEGARARFSTGTSVLTVCPSVASRESTAVASAVGPPLATAALCFPIPYWGEHRGER